MSGRLERRTAPEPGLSEQLARLGHRAEHATRLLHRSSELPIRLRLLHSQLLRRSRLCYRLCRPLQRLHRNAQRLGSQLAVLGLLLCREPAEGHPRAEGGTAAALSRPPRCARSGLRGSRLGSSRRALPRLNCSVCRLCRLCRLCRRHSFSCRRCLRRSARRVLGGARPEALHVAHVYAEAWLHDVVNGHRRPSGSSRCRLRRRYIRRCCRRRAARLGARRRRRVEPQLLLLSADHQPAPLAVLVVQHVM